MATIEEIARRGTRGLRVEDVAKRAGCSTALIYHHFGDRTSLLQAALGHIGERAAVYTESPAGTGRERLVAMLVDEVQDLEAVRINSTAWGELRDAAIFDTAIRPTLAVLTKQWIDDIAELVRHGHADGSVAEQVDPIETGIALSALVEGISTRWLNGLLTTDDARRHLANIAGLLLRPVSG